MQATTYTEETNIYNINKNNKFIDANVHTYLMLHMHTSALADVVHSFFYYYTLNCSITSRKYFTN